MPTILELAEMSNAVYDLTNAPNGWTQVDAKTAPPRSGLQAATYTQGSETVIAFRGTVPSQSGDLQADAMLGLGMNCEYFAEAEAYASAHAGDPSKTTLCGHSLGGAITQIVGNRQSIKFATFNAPGVALFASRNIGSSTVTGLAVRTAGATLSAVMSPRQAWRDIRATFNVVNGLNVRLRMDVVSMIGVHYGDIVSLETPSWSPAEAHGIGTVIGVLRGVGAGTGARSL
ncbi:MAG TPA: hypothetical protein VF699_00365 [Caulobacteraceae bacterium]|jgi:hypothetical protein